MAGHGRCQPRSPAAAAHIGRPQRLAVVAQAQDTKTKERPQQGEAPSNANPFAKLVDGIGGLGDTLGPIGLTYGSEVKVRGGAPLAGYWTSCAQPPRLL